MHVEAFQAVKSRAQTYGLSEAPLVALDLGGQWVNGSTRLHFRGAQWTGLDIVAGPGIDIVADGTTWEPDKEYDLVMCTEVLEHVQDWKGIVTTAAKALKTGGHLVLTCASTGRPEHSSVGDQIVPAHEWYGNVDPDDLTEHAATLFSYVSVEYNAEAKDAYMVAIK